MNIQAVIAKGFAFICMSLGITVSAANEIDERNQLNMGLFSVKLQDDEFYSQVHEDSIVTIDKDSKTIQIEGLDKVFYYEQSEIEEALLDAGGVMPLYTDFGNAVFRQLTKPKRGKKETYTNGAKKESSISW